MKTINHLIYLTIIILVFLLPLFFLPFTVDFYFLNKQTLVIAITSLLLTFWLIKMIIGDKLIFRKTPLDLPIIFFALAYVITTLVASQNKITILISPNGPGTIFVLTALYFILTNNILSGGLKKENPSEEKIIKNIIYSFIASVTLLALIAIYQFFGLGEILTSFPWLRNKLFTPSGGSLALISILITGLGITANLFSRYLKSRENWLICAFYGGLIFLISIALILTLYQILPDKETSLAMVSYQDSWAIAIETLKHNPLFGVGPGNYLSAFNRFRPITFNNNVFWNIRFNNASCYPLELLTIGGLFVLTAYLFIILKTLKLYRKSNQEANINPLISEIKIGTALTLLIPWFLGINFLLLCYSIIFLALLAVSISENNSPIQSIKHYQKGETLLVLVIGLPFVIFPLYLWSRVYLADVAFKNSLKAFEKNKGVEVYNYQIRAINLNPYNPLYRRVYSQTNLTLANSLASQSEISDQDRNNITRLIQQAIREAKIATVLNPTDSANWENLAQIYRNLINFAQGADQWAITSYRQAIITDPINPRLRLDLGGLYYALQNYDEAIRHFQDAINLKPDYANGYYNLAAAYREQEKYQLAYQTMLTVLNLLPPDSKDYQKAKNEAEELAKKMPSSKKETKPTEQTTETTTLTEPPILPSPVIQPPIELPEESEPEIPE